MVSELKVGHVIVTRGTHFLNRIIQMGMGNYWSHVGWIVAIEGEYVYIQEAKFSKNKVVTNKYPKYQIYEQYDDNKLGILDFKIRPNTEFYNIVRENEGKQYDHIANFIHFLRRIKSFFKKNDKVYAYTTESLVNCSEMVSRSIFKLKSYPILELLKKKRFDQIKPQDIAILHDKLQNEKLLD